MKMMAGIIIFLVLGLSAGYVYSTSHEVIQPIEKTVSVSSSKNAQPSPQPQKILAKLPAQYEIPSSGHVAQTFNNCGPAALSMIMSYFGTNISQDVLREQMRPFNNPAGGIDDKSIFANEFVAHAQKNGFEALARPSGTSAILKQLIAADVPVVLRTWLHPNEDIGHFRIVRGYDDARGVFIQDDSYEGKGLEYSYETFDAMWQPFNYGYIVVYPKEKADTVARILGEDMNASYAYKNSLTANADRNSFNQQYILFNQATAYYHLGEYQKSVEAYESAMAAGLPSRMLWYQIEPIQAYLKVGNYEQVLSLTSKNLNNGNTAFSEMYFLQGQVYLAQGNTDAAKAEFEKAVYYNKYYSDAQKALEKI